MAIQFGGRPDGSMLKELPPLLRSRGARWGAVAALSAGLWAYVVFGAGGLGRQRDFLERRTALQEQLAAELAANDELRAEVEALRGDDLAIEAAIRTQLDYQRPGELVEAVGKRDPLGVDGGTRPPPRRVVPPLPERLKPKPRPGPGAASRSPR